MTEEDWTFAHLRRVETLWGPHGYHRYPAKFIPQLVARIIERYSEQGDLVGDPFLGSATTGVEALRLGRYFNGSDISQVALLISRAKCMPIYPADLEEHWQQLEARLYSIPRIGRRYLTDAEIENIVAVDIARATGEARLNYWFPAPYRLHLEAILRIILEQQNDTIRTFFLCGFSNILKRCSIWLSGSTKAQKDLNKVPGDPVEEFRHQIRDMLQRNRLYWQDIIQYGLNPTTFSERCTISHADARCLPLPDASLDLLVTSPPYAICYEYKEIHQLTQLWFEQYEILCPPDTDTHDAWIGSKGVSQRIQPAAALPHTGSRNADVALHTLTTLAHGSVAQSVQREIRALHYYFQDMHRTLRECVRVTAPKKHVVFIVGDSYRRGITIPTSNALCEMAEALGLVLERDIVRKIPVRVLVSTRDKTTGRFSATAQSDAEAYPEEHVLIFRRTSAIASSDTLKNVSETPTP